MDGRKITAEELESRIAGEFTRLRQEEYELRRGATLCTARHHRLSFNTHPEDAGLPGGAVRTGGAQDGSGVPRWPPVRKNLQTASLQAAEPT